MNYGWEPQDIKPGVKARNGWTKVEYLVVEDNNLDARGLVYHLISLSGYVIVKDKTREDMAVELTERRLAPME